MAAISDVLCLDGLPLETYRKVNLEEPFHQYAVDTNGVVYGKRGKALTAKRRIKLCPLCCDGKPIATKTQNITNIVATAFLVKGDPAYGASNLNGDKYNNKLINVRWLPNPVYQKSERFRKLAALPGAPDDLDQFKSAKGISSLIISCDGRAFSTSTMSFLTPYRKRSGYWYVSHRCWSPLTNEVNMRSYSIARLVANAWTTRPPGGKKHEHIDGDKSNNHVDNLKWIINEKKKIVVQDETIPADDQLRILPSDPSLIVSRDGRVFDSDTRTILPTRVNSKDYYTISKHGTKCVHKLVAEAWNPNPENYPVVDHHDTDNLVWCTRLYNKGQAIKNGLIPHIRVTATNEEDGTSRDFESLREASQYLCIDRKDISKNLEMRLLDNRCTIKGYSFKYRDRPNDINEMYTSSGKRKCERDENGRLRLVLEPGDKGYSSNVSLDDDNESSCEKPTKRQKIVKQ
jgi:hypothetical protein